jgi:hypothetical protein
MIFGNYGIIKSWYDCVPDTIEQLSCCLCLFARFAGFDVR